MECLWKVMNHKSEVLLAVLMYLNHTQDKGWPSLELALDIESVSVRESGCVITPRECVVRGTAQCSLRVDPL